MYCQKSAATLKASAVVLHPINKVILNFNEDNGRYLFDYDYTFVGFLPVSDSVHGHIRDCDETDDAGSFLVSYFVVPLKKKLPYTSENMEEILK